MGGSDKGIHFALYFILAFLGGRYQLARQARTSIMMLLLWTTIYAGYAAADEWLQQFVGRTTSLEDWTADLLGIAVGTVVVALVKR